MSVVDAAPDTASETQSADLSGAGVRPGDVETARVFGRLAGGFWGGEDRAIAWFWSSSLAAMILANVAVNVGINHWHGWFFNALEQRDAATAGRAIIVFPFLVLLAAGVGVLILKTRETLQVHWRRWLSVRLIDAYLARRRFQRLGMAGLEPTNPEYRMTDDVRWATEPPVDFAIGLLSAVITTVTFVGILWSIGGSLTVGGEGGMRIPAYLVLSAVLYGAIVSTLMLVIGARLPRKYADRNEAEARLRFRMMRVRDNADTVALTKAHRAERAAIGLSYDNLVFRWLDMIRERVKLTWITNGNGALVPIVPLLLATPKYLAGEMSLGGVMQVAAAFVQVQIAFNWIVENYMRIAEWLASARRVNEMQAALDDLEALPAQSVPGPRLVQTSGQALAVLGLVLHDREDRPVAGPLYFSLGPGQSLRVETASGEAGSLLLRALAGQLGHGAGEVRQPEAAQIMAAVRRGRLPEARLVDILTSAPRREAQAPDGRGATLAKGGGPAEMGAVLGRCGLAHLASRLDEIADWDRVLSEADRQRLAFARLHLAAPDIILIDDALSAVGEVAARALFEDLRAALPQTIIVANGVHEVYGGCERVLDPNLAASSAGAWPPTPAVPPAASPTLRHQARALT